VGALGKAFQQVCSGDEDILDFCSEIDSEDNPLDPWKSLVRLEGVLEDSFTPNYKFGLLWQPVPWFSWGAMYRTSADVKAKGALRLTYNDTLAALLNEPVFELLGRDVGKQRDYDDIKVSLNVSLPAQFATGISLQVFPDLKLNIDYRKSYYSEWRNWDLELRDDSWLSGLVKGLAGTDVVPVPNAFKDTKSIAYGMEYRLNDRWTLRMGYEDRPSSTTGEWRFLTPLPGIDFKLKTFGGQYTYDKHSVIDFAFSYIRVQNDVKYREDDLIQIAPGHDLEWDIQLIVTQFTWRRQY
ncbi:MAG: outer membrane protein transport protein, partial [Pseudomonadales bacterium]|nr:outer membrane protein transport protein [Pseudomonadales bacterium]